MNITQSQLIEFNQRGLIPGPEESDEHFFSRILHVEKSEHFNIPDILKAQYDLQPDWISIETSNKGLSLWQGGCLWIEESNNHIIGTIQLRTSSLYSFDEILGHELVHAARITFEEPKFEEILAYRTSTSKLRRFLGPFFHSTNEALVLLIIFLTSIASNLIAFFYDSILAMCYVTWILSIFCISFGMIRLCYYQLRFKRCQKKLASLLGISTANALILRLSDKEILHFAKVSSDEIKKYIQLQLPHSLRWKMLTASYLNSL